MRTSLHFSTLMAALAFCTGQSNSTTPWCYQSQSACNNTCVKPETWPRMFPACGGQRQSPVNIVTNRVQYDPKLGPFIFEGHDHISNITVNHFELTAQFSLPHSLRLHGGGLPGVYKALQFHLHWGVNAGPGSEHTVDGERYPMELHVVYIKEKYQTLKQAENDTSGLAVLGFFFEESLEDNPYFDTVIEAQRRVHNHGDKSLVENFNLSKMLPPANELSSYYRYTGSLTTPRCNEIVVWTIFHRTLPASHRQLVEVAQEMCYWTGAPMTDIFRPVQPLNGRVVYKSIPSTSAVEHPGLTSIAVLLLHGPMLSLCCSFLVL